MNRKTLFIVLGILAALIIVIVLLFRSQQGVEVEVLVAPSESTVTLDGKEINPGTVRLGPGEHTFVASLEFFTDAVVTVNAAEIEDGHQVFLSPGVGSPEAEEWLRNHQGAVAEIENLGGLEYAAETQRTIDRYPYIERLPYSTLDYEIDFGFDDNGEIRLIVTIVLPSAVPEGTPEYDLEYQRIQEKAQNYLRDLDVDIENTNIEYTTS